MTNNPTSPNAHPHFPRFERSNYHFLHLFIYLFDASKVENGLQMIIFECIDQRVCYKNISFTLYVTKHKQKVNILLNLDLFSFPSCSGLPPR